jgi:hypothetical protein
MCLIAICEKRKLTEEEIRTFFSANPDGAGLAYLVTPGKLYYSKGLMHEEEFLVHYTNVKVLPHVIHFRTASSGPRDILLTHPFEIPPRNRIYGETTRPLLFHNGTWTNWREHLTNLMISLASAPSWVRERLVPPFSDSKLLAYLLSFYKYDAYHFLATLIPHDRFVIFYTNGWIAAYPCKGAWYNKDGVLLSSHLLSSSEYHNINEYLKRYRFKIKEEEGENTWALPGD